MLSNLPRDYPEQQRRRLLPGRGLWQRSQQTPTPRRDRAGLRRDFAAMSLYSQLGVIAALATAALLVMRGSILCAASGEGNNALGTLDQPKLPVEFPIPDCVSVGLIDNSGALRSRPEVREVIRTASAKLKSADICIKACPLGRALAVYVPGEYESTSRWMVWPDWQEPQTFIEFDDLVTQVRFISPTLVVVGHEKEGQVVDIQSRERAAIRSPYADVMALSTGEIVVVQTGGPWVQVLEGVGKGGELYRFNLQPGDDTTLRARDTHLVHDKYLLTRSEKGDEDIAIVDITGKVRGSIKGQVILFSRPDGAALVSEFANYRWKRSRWIRVNPDASVTELGPAETSNPSQAGVSPSGRFAIVMEIGDGGRPRQRVLVTPFGTDEARKQEMTPTLPYASAAPWIWLRQR